MNEADLQRRQDGARAQAALEVVEEALAERAERKLTEADALHAANELTPEKAYALLVSILEARHVVEGLRASAEHGLAASMRIQKEIDQQVQETARAEKAAVYGLNRFTRSKVPPRPRPPAA